MSKSYSKQFAFLFSSYSTLAGSPMLFGLPLLIIGAAKKDTQYDKDG
jgi:hypothetical protein